MHSAHKELNKICITTPHTVLELRQASIDSSALQPAFNSLALEKYEKSYHAPLLASSAPKLIHTIIPNRAGEIALGVISRANDLDSAPVASCPSPFFALDLAWAEELFLPAHRGERHDVCNALNK